MHSAQCWVPLDIQWIRTCWDETNQVSSSTATSPTEYRMILQQNMLSVSRLLRIALVKQNQHCFTMLGHSIHRNTVYQFFDHFYTSSSQLVFLNLYTTPWRWHFCCNSCKNWKVWRDKMMHLCWVLWQTFNELNNVGTRLYHSGDLRSQTYKEPVQLKYEKLAAKYIFGLLLKKQQQTYHAKVA